MTPGVKGCRIPRGFLWADVASSQLMPTLKPFARFPVPAATIAARAWVAGQWLHGQDSGRAAKFTRTRIKHPMNHAS